MFLYCNGDREKPDHMMLDERLNGQMHLNGAWFNAAISDYQCIGNNDVGSDCVFKSNIPGEENDALSKKGVCVLTQTLTMMGSRIENNQPVQR